MPDSIGNLRKEAREAARRAGVSPRDVDLLLADLIGRDPVYLVTSDARVLTAEESARFEQELARRLAGEPVQYIRGHCEFYGRTFHVDRRVLIPRPETEIICEHALSVVRPGMIVVDVGCGSGAIAATLALESPELRVVATDVSFDAILLARANARRLGARVSFVAGDLLAPLRGPFGLVVSNPPYIPDEEISGLQREVAGHEPHLALSGGAGGLVIIRRLIEEAGHQLAPDGTLILEIGWNQSARLIEVGEDLGFRVEVFNDLAGTPRCGILTLAPPRPHAPA